MLQKETMLSPFVMCLIQKIDIIKWEYKTKEMKIEHKYIITAEKYIKHIKQYNYEKKCPGHAHKEN